MSQGSAADLNALIDRIQGYKDAMAIKLVQTIVRSIIRPLHLPTRLKIKLALMRIL
jgi:hypothetical protein